MKKSPPPSPSQRPLHLNAWRPDTCACTVVYGFDDTLPETERVHIPVHHPDHTKQCPAHAHHATPEEHHAAVVAENRHKNIAVHAAALACGWAPESRDATGRLVAPEQNPHAAPHRIAWQHDATRRVAIDHGAVGITRKTLEWHVAAEMVRHGLASTPADILAP